MHGSNGERNKLNTVYAFDNSRNKLCDDFVA